jgi:hypothetical protein
MYEYEIKDEEYPSKFFIEHLTIEVTRRCNLWCEHCMRGDPQDISIKSESIDHFLDNIQGIRNITITGGEPSLAIQEMKCLLKKLKKRGVDYYHFYLVTNGFIATRDFFHTCLDFREYALCSGIVAISNDTYHPRPPLKNIRTLTSVPFVRCWEKADYEPDELIAEGRAENFGLVKHVPEPVRIDRYHITSRIYLNALGFVLSESCLSYKTQDKHCFTISEASNFSYQAVARYNSKTIFNQITENDFKLSSGDSLQKAS